MTTISEEAGLLSYENYLIAFENWVEIRSTSSANASEALVEFTKLNWHRTQRLHKTISINPELVEAVEKIQHSYTWVVLTEAWCGDSAQNLPLIAEIAKLNPAKIKLNILLRDENLETMDKHLTNGTRAIPKLVVINETLGKEAFVWGPRPKPAQAMLLAWKKNPEGKTWDEFENALHGWYAKDKTQTAQEEFLSLFQNMM